MAGRQKTFSFPWGSGVIAESVQAVGEHHKPTLQLMKYTDGEAKGMVAIRFCTCSHGGCFSVQHWSSRRTTPTAWGPPSGQRRGYGRASSGSWTRQESLPLAEQPGDYRPPAICSFCHAKSIGPA